MNRKEFERRQREIADEESKARSESEDRQAKIKVLWQDLEKDLARLKRERADQDELDKDELVEILTELAPLQKDEIEYLKQFRRDWERIRAHYPEQLQNLSGKSLLAESSPVIKQMLAKQKPKQRYERKRHRVQLGLTGEIEWEFGGATSSVPLSPVAWRHLDALKPLMCHFASRSMCLFVNASTQAGQSRAGAENGNQDLLAILNSGYTRGATDSN